MSIADEIEAEVTTYGQQVVLRRVNALGTNLTQTDVTLFAVVRGYRPYRPPELVGMVSEADIQVIMGNKAIAAAGWPGPPQRDDEIVIDGKARNVVGVQSIELDGEILRHDVWVRG